MTGASLAGAGKAGGWGQCWGWQVKARMGLTCDLEHPHFGHLSLAHVQHQLMLAKEVLGGLGAQDQQGHVLKVWKEKSVA